MKNLLKMRDEKIATEVTILCDKLFPEDEIRWCLLAHELACFAEYVYNIAECNTMILARDGEAYEIDEVTHG